MSSNGECFRYQFFTKYWSSLLNVKILFTKRNREMIIQKLGENKIVYRVCERNFYISVRQIIQEKTWTFPRKCRCQGHVWKILSLFSKQGNANQNLMEISFHTCQTDKLEKPDNLLDNVHQDIKPMIIHVPQGGNGNWYNHFGKLVGIE